MKLKEDDFKFIVKSTILVAIDLIIKNKNDEILLGFRKDRPAKNFWFVPGGRIFKNEEPSNSINRILRDEVGLDNISLKVTFDGIYEHNYPDNYWGETGFNTHYIVIAVVIKLNNNQLSALLSKINPTQLKFFPVVSLLEDEKVHKFTKNYFINHPDNKIF